MGSLKEKYREGTMIEKHYRIPLLSSALGLWLIAFTLSFGFTGAPIDWSELISGLALISLGFSALHFRKSWPIWCVGIVGFWLQISPVLFWAPKAAIYINDTLTGAIAIVLPFFFVQEEELPTTSHPTGWSFNPSGWFPRILTVGLGMLCWFCARYMAAFQLGYIDQIWDPFFTDGTLSVITSQISRDFPVSDAGLGAFSYTLESLLGWQGCKHRFAKMPWLVLAFGILVIPVSVVSIVLIILQPVVVGAWCTWCLATAVFMLAMILLTGAELVAVLQYLHETRQKGGNVWQVFWKGGDLPKTAVGVKPRDRRAGTQAWGFTLPPNLAVTALLGIWLMASPSILGITGGTATSNYILGPLVTTFSVIAFVEVFRSARFILIAFGAGLLLAPWLSGEPSAIGISNNLVVGAATIALSFRKGKIRERYGAFERWMV